MLVEKGYTARRKISRSLKLQGMIIGVMVTAILAITVTPQADRAYAGPATGNIQVSARVIAHSHMKVLYQVSRVRITQADIQRGYIDINSASRFEVWSNNPRGYIVLFRGADATPFKGAHAKANGTSVYLYGGQVSVRRPYVRGSEIVEFSYRLILSDNVRPGTYAWPINIEVPDTYGM